MSQVIKLGGSLLETAALPACLESVVTMVGPVVIVPGGGPFAEQVRAAQNQWHFDDTAAHRMAILAMQQMALLIHSLVPAFSLIDDVDTLPAIWPAQPKLIWSPSVAQLDRAGLAASWDITSDSLAAWLAGQLGVDELIIVKSAEIVAGMSLIKLHRQGIVDAAFLKFTAQADYKITVINKDRFCRHD